MNFVNYYDLPFKNFLEDEERAVWTTFFSIFPSGQGGWCAAEAPVVLDKNGRPVARIGKQNLCPSQRMRGEDIGVAFTSKAARRANRR